MEQGGGTSRYWCHMCSQTVNDPIRDIESMKCPNCESGFVEEMASSTPNIEANLDSERALSLWAPILLGMMANPIRQLRPLRQLESHEDHNGDEEDSRRRRMRRRRSSAAILQLLQGIRAGMMLNSSEIGDSRESNRDGQGQGVILINPLNQSMIVQDHRAPIASLGDYFMGPGLDLLLQHLAENDPSRSGTPPAQREAVEALATVTIEEPMQCAVCLDDCDLGSQLKEMPCRHKFHSNCIVPWLHLHSSCPVCRYKLVSSSNSTTTTTSNQEDSSAADNDSGTRSSLPLLWPFSTFFSSSASQSTATNWSLTPPSTDAPPTADHN